MQDIYNMISDSELMDELADCFRKRSLEQKFLYLQQWASKYYDDKNNDEIYWTADCLGTQDIIDFWQKYIFNKKKKTAIISLWCWNSEIEKMLFEKIWDKYNFTYFGIDSSKTMLDLSIQNLSKLDNIPQKYICADFSSTEFRRDLNQLTADFDQRIFCFFSNTFGNINQTNIIDILYNLLDTNEQIWLDVRLRVWLSAKDDMKAFEFYYNKLKKDKSRINFCFYILNKVWVPFENWQLSLETEKEKAVNWLKFKYSFIFNKKTHINIKGDKITVLPWEKMELPSQLTYDPNWLIDFFAEHDFHLTQKQLKKTRWQFLFKKK